MANKKTSLDKLVKFLETNPELADKMLNAVTEPDKQDADVKVSNGDKPSQVQVETAIRELETGNIKMEKGPVSKEVWQSLSVCGCCGKEQKTYTHSPEGKVTQHICRSCLNKMSLMATEAERMQFMQDGLDNDYLGAAKAKWKHTLQRFKKQREKEAEQVRQRNSDGPNPYNFSVTGE